MGNECDQCEAVTEGCKRQKFRQELKNRQKLNLSASSHNNHPTAYKYIVPSHPLKNHIVVDISPNSNKNQSWDNDCQLLSGINANNEINQNNPINHQQIRNERSNGRNQQQQQQQFIIENNLSSSSLKYRRNKRDQEKPFSIINNSIDEIYEDFREIRLPIQSGVDNRKSQENGHHFQNQLRRGEELQKRQSFSEERENQDEVDNGRHHSNEGQGDSQIFAMNRQFRKEKQNALRDIEGIMFGGNGGSEGGIQRQRDHIPKQSALKQIENQAVPSPFQEVRNSKKQNNLMVTNQQAFKQSPSIELQPIILSLPEHKVKFTGYVQSGENKNQGSSRQSNKLSEKRLCHKGTVSFIEDRTTLVVDFTQKQNLQQNPSGQVDLVTDINGPQSSYHGSHQNLIPINISNKEFQAQIKVSSQSLENVQKGSIEVLLERNAEKYSGDWSNSTATTEKKSQNLNSSDNGNQRVSRFSPVPHGTGYRKLSNGDKYEGSFVNGRQNGFGRLIFFNNHEIQNRQLDSRLNQKSLSEHENLMVYQGDFMNGKFHGYGKLYNTHNCTIYEGQFENGIVQGEGQILYDVRQKLFDWKCKSLKLQLQEKETKPFGEGSRYQNSSLNAQFDVAANEEEKSMIDRWQKRQKRYVGGFIKGKRQGYGRYFYGDGREWEGEWSNNMPNGKGKYRNESGEILKEGLWSNGKSIN